MKLAVLADVHSNWPALQAVAADIERWQADRVVVAGDVINRGPRPVECLDFVLSSANGWRLVLGNHEEYVLSHVNDANPSWAVGTNLGLIALDVHQAAMAMYRRCRHCPFSGAGCCQTDRKPEWCMPPCAALRDCIFPDTPMTMLRAADRAAPQVVRRRAYAQSAGAHDR